MEKLGRLAAAFDAVVSVVLTFGSEMLMASSCRRLGRHLPRPSFRPPCCNGNRPGGWLLIRPTRHSLVLEPAIHPQSKVLTPMTWVTVQAEPPARWTIRPVVT